MPSIAPVFDCDIEGVGLGGANQAECGNARSGRSGPNCKPTIAVIALSHALVLSYLTENLFPPHFARVSLFSAQLIEFDFRSQLALRLMITLIICDNRLA